MTPGDREYMEREIGRALREALQPIFHTRTSRLAVSGARDVARLLQLEGLERLLAALEALAGGDWPERARPAIEHLARLSAASTRADSPAPFRAADDDTGAIASGIVSRAPAGHAPREPQMRAEARLSDVLSEMHVMESEARRGAAGVSLEPAVAAALRASVDWLSGQGLAQPVELAIEASTVCMTLHGIDPSGLRAAHETLAAQGGNLSPALAPARGNAAAWVIRVPARTERPLHLMITQGPLSLAIPWHAVVRVQIGASRVADLPRIATFAPLEVTPTARAYVTVGLGMKLALLEADRIVWRLAADPVEGVDAPPASGLSGQVESEEGERFWVVGLAEVMREVPEPPSMFGRARESAPAKPPAAPRVLASSSVRPIHVLTPPLAPPPAPGPSDEAEASAARGADEHAPTAVSTEDDSAPATPATADAEVVQAPATEVRAPIESPPVPVRSQAQAARESRPTHSVHGPGSTPKPRALIAEDSITARVFLARLLERQGFEVDAVGTATDFFERASTRTWALLCIDIELPDARGEGLLREALATQTWKPAPGQVVALVRDHADGRVADAAGIRRTFLKPFDEAAVSTTLERIGLVRKPA